MKRICLLLLIFFPQELCFSQRPELSNKEIRTSRIVAERLKALGLEVNTGYGVIGILKGSQPGAVVAVRADMDALPIQETNDVPHESKMDGVMHACGHDVHTTIALGTAEVLAGMRNRLRGTVKFIFQPSEEDWPDRVPAGAARMIKEGALLSTQAPSTWMKAVSLSV